MNRRPRITAWAAALLCMSLAFAQPSKAADRTANPASVKVAYLFNFAKFVAWPPQLGQTANSPISICILADRDFVTAADVLRGKTIKGRPVDIRIRPRQKDFAACHLLYFGRTKQGLMDEAYEFLREHPVLTVGEGNGFADAGGIIQMMKVDGTIRFRINAEAARNADLEISSKLLNLSYKPGR